MQERYLRNVIEAALLAAGRPLSVAELIEVFDAREQPAAEEVRRCWKRSKPTTPIAVSSSGKWPAAFVSRSGTP